MTVAASERYGSLPKALEAWESEVTCNLAGSSVFYRAAAYWLSGERLKAMRFVDEPEAAVEQRVERDGRQSDAAWFVVVQEIRG